MEIKIWGVRGSIPVHSAHTKRYGGNTTCIQLIGEENIIIDAGTGIRALGDELVASSKKGHCTILLTHAHRDHLQGLTFFAPIFNENWSVDIIASDKIANKGLEAVMEDMFDGESFPLRVDDLKSKLKLITFKDGAEFKLGKILVQTCQTNHPSHCVAYKLKSNDWTFFFSGDHELDINEPNFKKFVYGVDLALVDAQYNQDNYQKYIGFGHSSKEDWCNFAYENNIKRLYMTHYAPDDTDSSLDSLLIRLKNTFSDLALSIEFAKEGLVLTKKGQKDESIDGNYMDMPCVLCDFSREISKFSDVSMILDGILSEARRISYADAGTIYLIEENELVFSYTQNDTLFPGSAANKQIYRRSRLPINTSSISGYVAYSAEVLNIANVYELDSTLSYSFNSAFDKSTNYKTVSMLTVPFIGKKGNVVGVLQLINCLEDGMPTPFTYLLQSRVERLSVLASDAIERSINAREMILRMLQISALRDPLETTSHVMRVGATVAEIYEDWAIRKDIDKEEMRHTKDELKVASMLHDIGKVGVPDRVLKKPGKLDLEERAIMEEHCIMGARLFDNASNNFEILSREIALHHHQKWNGNGYTGDPNVAILSGESIPLGARITAVADVFDALMSKRCYKEPWTMEDAVATILQDSGTHFDPDIVKSFMNVLDVIIAIRDRYQHEDI